MAGAFPDTPVTLLAKIAGAMTGGKDEMAWIRFFGLYQPTIRKFAEMQGAGEEAEDITQEVLIKLVDVLREGKYSSDVGKFRTYLSTVIRREVTSNWRRRMARIEGEQAGRSTAISTGEDAWKAMIDSQDAGLMLDAKWKLARHEAAVEHALCKTALSAKTKAIYRSFVLEERSLKDVMEEFGVSKDVVRQSKSRVGKMIAAIEAELE